MNEASKYFKPYEEVDHSFLYNNWHTGRYFLQCYFNLQEIYDCGGMTEEEWKCIYKVNCLELNKSQDIMGLTPITDMFHNEWKEPLDYKVHIQELKYALSNTTANI